MTPLLAALGVLTVWDILSPNPLVHDALRGGARLEYLS